MNTNDNFDINRISADIIDRNIDKVLKKFGKLIKTEINKIKIDYNFAFKTYIENAYERYSKVKTLLYRTEPKYIYDFFECNTLLYDKKEINPNDIDRILDISHYIIIQGTGGIGKTILLKHLFINELSKNDLIPIMVELKNLNEEGLFRCAYDTIQTLGFNLSEEFFEYAMKTGCFLLLFDGFDEISGNKHSDSLNDIAKFCDKYNKNYFIISSRPINTFISLQRFTVLESLPFSKKQAIDLVKKLDYDKVIKEKFLNELTDNLYDKHKSFASIPLLLNIMLMTYDNYAEIPEKLHIFYENAFETLYSKHDATKGGYKREMLANFPKMILKRYLQNFVLIHMLKRNMSFQRMI